MTLTIAAMKVIFIAASLVFPFAIFINFRRKTSDNYFRLLALALAVECWLGSALVLDGLGVDSVAHIHLPFAVLFMTVLAILLRVIVIVKKWKSRGVKAATFSYFLFVLFSNRLM